VKLPGFFVGSRLWRALQACPDDVVANLPVFLVRQWSLQQASGGGKRKADV